MAFCTSCGHNNPNESLFCEECGKSLKKSVAPQPAQSATNPPAPVAAGNPLPRRGLMMIAGGIAAIIAGGLAAYMLLANESPNTGNLQAAVTRYLTANPDFSKSRYCLRNFAYSKDPVFVSGHDSSTQQWMNLFSSVDRSKSAPSPALVRDTTN